MKTKLLITSLISLLLYSCAQVVPLSGGEKDIVPPKEIKSTPINGSTNFNSSKIIIEFDEFIRLNNINNQLIVSPIIKPKPLISVKGKKIIIKLPDSLLINTTYSFNFGEAITDITENNSSLNYKYVFSTGSYLDSLSYSGTIVGAFDLQPKEKVFVFLYDKIYDSIPLKELPRYIALSDKEGIYKITNIAEGDYKLFALKDINNNYLFDLPNEEIAFKNKPLTLKTSLEKKRIDLFKEDHEQQYLKKVTHNKYGEINLLFNLATSNLNLIPLNIPPSNFQFLKEKNITADSLTIWLTNKNKISTLDFLVKDNAQIIDTVSIDLINSLKDSSLHIQSNITPSFDLNKSIILTAERPIYEIDTNQITLLEDSLPIKFKITPFNTISRKFKIQTSLKENKNYTLYIPSATFSDFYSLKNDTILHQFQTKKEEDYGAIILNLIPNFSSNYIIQLYKDKNLVKEVYSSSSQTFNFKYLLPGNYKLKMILDSNQNKKWDTGNYLKQQQAEKVILYQKEIKIRAYWDNEINWTVNE